MHFYEPHLGHRLPHDPFKSIVAPRPIGWISTLDELGRVNLAPYSFFNGVAEKRPVLMFAGGAHKDSVRNAETTGEFVYNMVTPEFADAMNVSSISFPHGVNEMSLARLEAIASKTVKPPRVAGVAAAIECKVIHVLRLVGLDGVELNQAIIVGEATGVHIDTVFLKDGIFDITAARPLARCGYRGDYTEVNMVFDMPSPTAERAKGLLGSEDR